MLFHVLGPLEVHAAAVHRLGAGKPATVLSVLLLHTNAWVTVDRLVTSVWPEQDAPASAAANLKTYVWQLRRMVGVDRIERHADAYRLRVAPGEMDADRVGLLATEADGLAAAGDPRAAAARLTEALALWRGRPFCGVQATEVYAARLDEQRIDLCERLAELHLDLGRAADAVVTLRAVTAEAPLREAAWARLVRALHATGRRTEAMAAFRQARDILDAELGVDPGPELVAAHRLVAGGARGGPDRRELPRDVRLVGRTGQLAALLRPTPVALGYDMAGAGKTTPGKRGTADRPDDRERELLALLAAGFTDESAAVRLGVSVRTVRRTMSAVMARLGARSRFQAGLRMAGLGLSTSGPSTSGPSTSGPSTSGPSTSGPSTSDPAIVASTTVGGCAGDCHGGRRGSAAGCRRVAARGGLRG